MQGGVEDPLARWIPKDEMPIRLLYQGIAGAFVLLSVLAMFSVPEIETWRALLMAVLGTVWIWMAGIILSECIGRTNWSPLSGMTLIGVTVLIFVAPAAWGIGRRWSLPCSWARRCASPWPRPPT